MKHDSNNLMAVRYNIIYDSYFVQYELISSLIIELISLVSSLVMSQNCIILAKLYNFNVSPSHKM